jgi:glycosyltransferase involved in cell wall biosynthesis
MVGGAERHVAESVAAVSGRGARSFLLHDADAPCEPAFTRLFDGAFPRVELARQVAAIRPDVLYVHQVAGAADIDAIADAGVPAVRFFHDHSPFCLRRHKYTTIGHRTCERPLGLRCWPCLGPINRADGFPHVSLRTLRSARAELDANRRLAAFAVGSSYMRDHVAAHGFEPGRIRVLPMFVGPAAPEVAGPRQPSSLLFAGALVRGKGLDVLLDALALLPAGVTLRVAGRGRQEAMFREQAARLGLGSRVSFLGFIRRPELDRHLAEVSCVVVPSREPETFGLVGLDAYRHGTPVVATAVGGVGEWLRHGRTGLSVPPGDPAALAGAISRVLDDPAAAAAMGAAGRELLATRFNADLHADALLDLLRSVAVGRRA